MLLEMPPFAVVVMCITAAILPPFLMAYLAHVMLPGDRVRSFAGAEPAVPEPRMALKKSELGSTTITSDLLRKLDR